MKYTVAYGNAFDGLLFEGVFDDADTALQYAERYAGGYGEQWNIVTIREREDTNGRRDD